MGLLDVSQTPPALSSNADSIIGAMSGVRRRILLIRHLLPTIRCTWQRRHHVFMTGWVPTNMAEMGLHYCSLLALFVVSHYCARFQHVHCRKTLLWSWQRWYLALVRHPILITLDIPV